MPYTGITTELDGRHAMAMIPMWIAAIAKLCGTHPTIVTHSLITLVFLALAVFYFLKLPTDRRYRPMRIITTFVAAGAIGNFIDRMMLSYVRDFLYFKLIDFPIFNVADIYVTCGAIAFFIFTVFYYKEADFEFMKKKKG